MHDAGGGTHSASTASSVVSPSAPGPPSRRCGRGGEEGGYVSGEICCFLTSRGWRWREARWTPGMRVLDRGRYVARAHLCAALTRTVADSFLPLRRVDAVAAISPALFLVNTFRELFASPLRGRAPRHAGPPSLSRARGLSRAPKTGPRPSPLGRPARLRGHPLLSRPSEPPRNILSNLMTWKRNSARPTVARTDKGKVRSGAREPRPKPPVRSHASARAHVGCDAPHRGAHSLASLGETREDLVTLVHGEAIEDRSKK